MCLLSECFPSLCPYVFAGMWDNEKSRGWDRGRDHLLHADEGHWSQNASFNLSVSDWLTEQTIRYRFFSPLFLIWIPISLHERINKLTQYKWKPGLIQNHQITLWQDYINETIVLISCGHLLRLTPLGVRGRNPASSLILHEAVLKACLIVRASALTCETPLVANDPNARKCSCSFCFIKGYFGSWLVWTWSRKVSQHSFQWTSGYGAGQPKAQLCQFPYSIACQSSLDHEGPCNALISSLRTEDRGAKRDMSEDTRGRLSQKSQDQHTALLEIC